MSKKIIKYLICIVLITVTVILMQAKQTMATIDDVLNNSDGGTIGGDDFTTSKNIFCLNHGYPYKGHFTKTDFNIENFKAATGKEFNVDEEDIIKNVLTYIISEANTNPKYSNKESVGTYIPQIAIWILAGSNVSDCLQNDVTAAQQLLADAFAYYNFIKDGSPIIPTIEKNGSDQVAIKYFQTTGTYDGATGTYTNLLFDTINVEGASQLKNPDGTLKKDEPLGNGYFRRIYAKDSGTAEVKVSFTYEKQRTSDLQIFKVKKEVGPGANRKVLYEDSLYSSQAMFIVER